MPRSGSDHCLPRHGLGRLRDCKAKGDKSKFSGSKASELGNIHIDVKYPPHMANKMSRGYLFVAINGASRRVFIAMYRHKTAETARGFLGDLKRACPMRSRTILPVWQAVHRPPSVCAGALPHDRTRLIRFTQLSVLNLGWPTETAANQRHG